MIFTFQQIQKLVEKVGNDKAIEIIKDYFDKVRHYLDSSDVAFIYDDDYFRTISNHPIAVSINDFIKINIYQYPSYHYLKDQCAGKRVLSIGSGLGDVELALALRGADVIGIENSIIALGIAKEKIMKLNIHNCLFLDEDLSNFSPDYFDFILMNDVTEHLSDRELDNIFTHLYRVLKHGGEIVIHTPNGSNIFLRTDPSFFHLLIDLAKIIMKKRRSFDLSVTELYQLQAHINIKSYRQLKAFLKKYGITKTRVIYDKPYKVRWLTKYFSPDMLVIGYKL